MAQRQTVPTARPLRADAERTMTAILKAAERTFSRDPAATMEQVAEAAGVARTTVHRRFATREALIDALGLWATQRMAAAVDAAPPDTAPPLVALYQATANVLRVKASEEFAMSRASAVNPEVARLHAEVRDACGRLFRRAQEAGLLRADADLEWTQRVYYALLHEAAVSGGEADADAAATRVVDTLLRGAGTAQPGFGTLPALPGHGSRAGGGDSAGRGRLRPRTLASGGLMRGREFTMADAYTFDASHAGRAESTRLLNQACTAALTAMGMHGAVRPTAVCIRSDWGDVLVRDGHFPVPRPFVPGFEAAGHVIAAGDEVEDVRAGDAVIALTAAGAYAEVAVAPAALIFPAAGIGLRTAAASGWSTPTAYDLINTVTRVQPGDRVLIHAAAGGVGTMAAQYARLAGAGHITGIAGDPGRAAYAASFGYDQVLTRDQFPAALGEEAFDVILDPVGGPTRTASLQRLAPHGRLAAYGNIATFEPVMVSANDLLMAGASLLTYNSSLLSQTNPGRLARSARAALQFLASGQVRTDITAEYEMADLGTAIQRLADGATHGKSILRIT